MHLWYFPGGGSGWVGEINNKDHLSPAEAGRWAELGNKTSLFYLILKYSIMSMNKVHLDLVQ